MVSGPILPVLLESVSLAILEELEDHNLPDHIEVHYSVE